MMAFFLLLWILGAIDEAKRKGLADYFTPTLVELRDNSAGSNGLLGGASIIAAENYPHKTTQTGTKAIVIPESTVGGTKQHAASCSEDRRRFEPLKKTLEGRMARTPALRNLKPHVRLTETQKGLRTGIVQT